MKSKRTSIFVLSALFSIPAVTFPAVVNFTAGEGYTPGTQLNSHSNWIAQSQWSIDATGDGVAEEITGSYTRGNYQGASAGNAIGERFVVEATFNMIGSYSAPASPLADYEEPIMHLYVTEEATAAPAARMGASLALEDDLGANELQFRLMGAASGSVNMGLSGAYDGHTFTLRVEYMKINPTNYTVIASLDSLDDAAAAFELTNSVVTPDAVFLSSYEVFGVIQTLPASSAAYGGVQVDQFKFEIPDPDLVAVTPVVVQQINVDAVLVDVEFETVLQVKTNLTDASWQDIEGTEMPSGLINRRYVDTSGSDEAQKFYRVWSHQLFFDDFEYSGSGGWVETPSATSWEKGMPNLNNGFVVLTNAASGFNCWGTDLDGDYSAGTDIKLTSPPIQLPATGPFTLEWMESIDIHATDSGFVNLIDLDAGTTNLLHTTGGINHSWSPVSVSIPPSAYGHTVQIEFHFLEGGTYSSAWGGWYIDDVAITDLP